MYIIILFILRALKSLYMRVFFVFVVQYLIVSALDSSIYSRTKKKTQ